MSSVEINGDVIRIVSTVNVETGHRYITSLTDLDVGLGNALALNIDGIREVEMPGASRALANFSSRKVREKLFLDNESNPKAFLQRLRQRLRDKEIVKGKQGDTLPIVYFHRIPSFAFNDDGTETFVKNVGQIFTNDPERGGSIVLAEVDEMPISISYQVYVLGWEQVSLNKIAAGVMAGFMAGTRKFSFDSLLLNSVITKDCFLAPAQSITWSDASMSSDEDRLLVLSAELSLKTHVYQARCVESKQVTVDVHMPVPFYHSQGDKGAM